MEPLSEDEARLEALRALSAKRLAAVALSAKIDRDFIPQWLRRDHRNRFQSEDDAADGDRPHLADRNERNSETPFENE